MTSNDKMDEIKGAKLTSIVGSCAQPLDPVRTKLPSAFCEKFYRCGTCCRNSYHDLELRNKEQAEPKRMSDKFVITPDCA